MPIKMMPSHVQLGFSMIELLVAVVVLAIGLLGMAGLQTAGLSNNQSAYFRSQATIAIADMVDRMRANTAGVKDRYYQSFDTSAAPASPNCISTSGGCNAQELADYDMREWAKLFTNVDDDASYVALLPNATGTISYNDLTEIYNIKISWQEMSWAAGGSKQAQTQSMQVNISL
jgi:type IV pilus assembly protein PilV